MRPERRSFGLCIPLTGEVLLPDNPGSSSDKLSRRAFPRGYTESLEERVRALEAEVRELKDLLDEKDEKIDMLSRLHSHSPQSNAGARRTSPSPSPCEQRAESQEKDEVFKIHQSPQLLDDENKDAYFVGSSSGRTLVGMIRTSSLLFICKSGQF